MRINGAPIIHGNFCQSKATNIEKIIGSAEIAPANAEKMLNLTSFRIEAQLVLK